MYHCVTLCERKAGKSIVAHGSQKYPARLSKSDCILIVQRPIKCSELKHGSVFTVNNYTMGSHLH